MPFHLQKPSLRWLAVNAKQTVLLAYVHAEQRTYPVPIFASATVSCQNDEDTQNKYETDDDDDGGAM